MVGEALLWLLFVSLLVPVGLTGWAIGHYTAGGKHTVTRTVTVTPATTQPPAAATTAATATTAAAATTAPATTAPATTAPATTAAATGNPARGKSVFISSGCGACHTFGPAASSATIGPDLDTKPALDAKKEHMQLAAFIRESIVSPNAYISSGYTSGVMPQTFRSTLSKIQLADLVAFITAGGK
ncbi:MAG TPA: c-type cytochrome [Gaiellaceae bacterium]|nr:c-type cytochrome [Gaiellaceae bacterium]